VTDIVLLLGATVFLGLAVIRYRLKRLFDEGLD
jgi:hypothetical protein